MHQRRIKGNQRLAVFSWILLLGVFIWLIIIWDQIPDQIAGHFSGFTAASVTRYDDKISLIPLICMMGIPYLVILFFGRIPGDWQLTKEQRDRYGEQAQQLTETFLLLIRIEYIALMAYLIYISIYIKDFFIGMLVILLSMVLTIGWFIRSYYKLKKEDSR